MIKLIIKLIIRTGGNILKIYVDGSYKPSVNPDVAGWAFSAYNEYGALLHSSYGLVKNPVSRQIDGELQATLEALKWVQSNKEKYLPKGGKVVIFHDYEGIGRWARNEWKTNTDLTKRYKQSVNELMLDLISGEPSIEVLFSWVKGHSNNAGNDLVDRLAGQAVVDGFAKKEVSGKQQILVDKEEIEKILELLKYPMIVPNVLTAKEHLLDLLKKFD